MNQVSCLGWLCCSRETDCSMAWILDDSSWMDRALRVSCWMADDISSWCLRLKFLCAFASLEAKIEFYVTKREERHTS